MSVYPRILVTLYQHLPEYMCPPTIILKPVMNPSHLFTLVLFHPCIHQSCTRLSLHPCIHGLTRSLVRILSVYILACPHKFFVFLSVFTRVRLFIPFYRISMCPGYTYTVRSNASILFKSIIRVSHVMVFRSPCFQISSYRISMLKNSTCPSVRASMWPCVVGSMCLRFHGPICLFVLVFICPCVNGNK
jgi:hypothetical protein